MKINKWIVLGVLAGFFLTLVGVGCNSGSNAPAAPSQIILKAADIQPEDYPTTMGMKYMAKLLDERSNGRIKMQVYGGGQLGQEKETIEMTQAGTIAFNRINAAPLASFSPRWVCSQCRICFATKTICGRCSTDRSARGC